MQRHRASTLFARSGGARLGVNVGIEQDGKGGAFLRPALILRGFGPDACLVVPLTTSQREHPLRIYIGKVDGSDARANLSQLRAIDTRRLVEKIGFLEGEVFASVREAVKAML